MPVSVDLAFTNSIRVQHSSEPYFLSDAGIEGCITLTDRFKFGFDLVKISLEGVLLNSIRSTTYKLDARKLQIVLRMSDVKKRSDLVHFVQHGKSISKNSFRFHVPQCLGRNLLGEDAEYLSDLPTSLSCSEIFWFGANRSQYSLTESQVVYTVRVDVIRREANVGTAMQNIHILPSLKPRPPICITDFGNEYTTKLTKPIRGKSRWSITKIGDCTIEAEEPQAVVLTRPNEPFTVSIPLHITTETISTSLRGRRGNTQVEFQQQHESILRSDFRCTGALISSTYISTTPRRGTPTQAEADKLTTLSRISSRCSKTFSNTSVSPRDSWTYHASSVRWQSQTTVTLKFDKFKNNEPILPSFDSSMLSRRYRIALKLQITNLTPTRLTFAFDIPVTIRYSSDGLNRNDDPPPFEDAPDHIRLDGVRSTQTNHEIDNDESRHDSGSDEDENRENYASSPSSPPPPPATAAAAATNTIDSNNLTSLLPTRDLLLIDRDSDHDQHHHRGPPSSPHSPATGVAIDRNLPPAYHHHHVHPRSIDIMPPPYVV